MLSSAAGRSPQKVGGCGRIWEDVGGCGRMWEDVGGCGRTWLEVSQETGCPAAARSAPPPSAPPLPMEGDLVPFLL